MPEPRNLQDAAQDLYDAFQRTPYMQILKNEILKEWWKGVVEPALARAEGVVKTGLPMKRRIAADKLYEKADLGAVECAAGWEESGDTIFRTVFVANPHAGDSLDVSGPTVARKLVVFFLKDSDAIDHATLDGNDIEP